MTGYNKVFIDTAPLIYFLDSDVHFGEKTRMILEEILSNRKPLVTSAVTCMEYLVYPYRAGNREKAEAFYDFLRDFEIPVAAITEEIADKAAVIRAEYCDFKAMDAIQLAAAVCCGCDLFLTNDRQLRQFRELKCVTAEEWLLN